MLTQGSQSDCILLATNGDILALNAGSPNVHKNLHSVKKVDEGKGKWLEETMPNKKTTLLKKNIWITDSVKVPIPNSCYFLTFRKLENFSVFLNNLDLHPYSEILDPEGHWIRILTFERDI